MKLLKSIEEAQKNGFAKYLDANLVEHDFEKIIGSKNPSFYNQNNWHFSKEIFIGSYSVTEKFPALVKTAKNGRICGFYKLLKGV